MDNDAMAPHGMADRRLEEVEALACADLYRAAPERVARDQGISFREVAGVLLMRVEALPAGHMFNRAMGVGAPGAHVATQVDEVGRFFDGQEHMISLHPDAPEGTTARLAAHGYMDGYPWDKFRRGTDPPPAVQCDLPVRIATPGDAGALGAVVSTVFHLPAFTGEWIAAVVGRPGWTFVVAEDGGTPVGAAGVHIAADSAWFGFGATLPEFRGRGVQGAFFAARIRVAREAGCTLLVTETGAPTDDGPGPSYRNMLRTGFQPAYRRANLRSAG